MRLGIWKIIIVLIGIIIWSNFSSGRERLGSLLPTKEISEKWELIEGPLSFTKRTLFDHINGQAELFLKYGFQNSIFAIYQDKDNPKNQIEVDIYDMENLLQAFGIFSRFRNEDRPGGFGLDSYLNDNSALFYKGKYFVMLYSNQSNIYGLKEIAKLISSKIIDTSPPPKEIDFFPRKGFKPGSIQYLNEGLLGYRFLKRGFQGTYIEEFQEKTEDRTEIKVKEFNLFLATFRNSQEAKNALKIYRDELLKKGKIESKSPFPLGANALKGEDPYHGNMIAIPKGAYILGAIGFEREKEVEDLLSEFMKNVR